MEAVELPGGWSLAPLVERLFVLRGEASGFFPVAAAGHDAPAAPSGGIEEQPSTPGPGACADLAERG